MTTGQQPVSAQVILQPATGAAQQAPVTAKHIAAHLPPEGAGEQVAKKLGELGFRTGTLSGNSFSITAPASLFEKIFGVKIYLNPGTGTTAQWKDKTVKDHLPVAPLPPPIAALVKDIVLPPPPSFGPKSY